MSDVKKSYGKSSVYGGIIIDIVEDSLERVDKLLEEIPDGLYKAVGSSLKRAAASGKTAVKKAVTDEYTISSGDFLRYTSNINHFDKSGGDLSVVFGYKGYVIPLLRFNTKVGSDGRIITQVKRSSAAEILNHAFLAQLGEHQGVYERIGPERFPVKELYGPATTQMMYSNEKVLDTVEEKMIETYEKRIDHEILRVLNGWGG